MEVDYHNSQHSCEEDDQIGNYKLALDNSLTQIDMPGDCLECTSMH